MITGWQTTSAADLAAIAKKYRGGGFAVTGPEYSAAKSNLGQNGFNTVGGYQQWKGLQPTGLIDPPTLGAMGIRGASSVSPLAGRGVAGPTGAPGATQPSTSDADGLGVDQFQNMARPPQNSMQRWQNRISAQGSPGTSSDDDDGMSAAQFQNTSQQRSQQAPTPWANRMGNQEQPDGLRNMSDANRYFWATGGKRIDARAPTVGYNPAPVTFTNPAPVIVKKASDWAPY